VPAVTCHTACGTGKAQYFADQPSPAADDAFERAEREIDVIEALTVIVSDVIWATINTEMIVSIMIDLTPNVVL
jgi:hypothetical protein